MMTFTPLSFQNASNFSSEYISTRNLWRRLFDCNYHDLLLFSSWKTFSYVRVSDVTVSSLVMKI